MWQILGTIFRESLQDNATGRYSSARVIAVLVALAATVFMWKLVILGGMTIDYFVAYLAYGTSQSTLNKLLDNKDGARIEVAKSMNAAPAALVVPPDTRK